MAKRKCIVYLVDIAASVPSFRQIARLLEVADDRYGRPFGDPDRGGDVSQPRVRVGGDCNCSTCAWLVTNRQR